MARLADRAEMGPRISAVIRTFNSGRTLEEVFRGLDRQTLRVAETVVVDSGSTDSTLGIAARHGTRIIHYPQGKEFNYSRALNIGIEVTEGEMILVLSSHVVLTRPETLHHMLDALLWVNAAGVYCSHLGSQDLQRSAPVSDRLLSVIYIDNFSGENGLWNTCSLIRKDLWRIHAFDESIAAVEDNEWAHWHFHHSKLPTVCLRNEGPAYQNVYENMWKLVRDELVKSERLCPQLRRWPAILGHARKAATFAALRDWRGARLQAWIFAAKAVRRIYSPPLRSAYFKTSESTPNRPMAKQVNV